MKNTMITEFVKIELLQTTTDEQLIDKAEILTQFLQQQDGFIDGELVKAIEGNIWYFIYHFENFEKLKVIGQKMRSEKMFDHIMPLIAQESMQVSFYSHLKSWQALSINKQI